MCLVCGKILCSQSYCCQTELDGVTVGAATEHAYKCGAGAGIFLRYSATLLLYLNHLCHAGVFFRWSYTNKAHLCPSF